MRTTEQINTFYELARERSADGETVRRRIAAIGAMSILVCGFLLAIGLGLLVLVFLAGMAASVAFVVLLSLWPRLLEGIRPRSRDLRARAAQGTAWTAARFARLGRTGSRSVRRAAETGSRLGNDLAQAARGTAIRFAPRPARLEPQREAIRLNATGTQHRRHGRHEEAVDCHRQATASSWRPCRRCCVPVALSRIASRCGSSRDRKSVV